MGMNTEETKFESQVQEKINEISRALETLQANATTVYDRLSTLLVLVDCIGGKEEVTKEPVLCALASVLEGKASENWTVNNKLSDILYRLRL